MKFYEFDNQDGETKFIPSDEFTEIKTCTSADGYGGTYGCYDSGCYSKDNSTSNFLEDMFEELELDINEVEEIAWTGFSFDNLYGNDFDYIFEAYPDKREEIKKWIEEHEDHTSTYAYEYYNGSNYVTLELEGLNAVEVELEIIDKRTPNKGVIDHILEVKNEDGEIFDLVITRYAGDIKYSKEEKGKY